MVLADNLAVAVNTVYNAPAEHSGGEFIIATLAFAIQIYCDFSAYSDIARGSAKMMGFDLMKNFRCPYLAVSIQDFGGAGIFPCPHGSRIICISLWAAVGAQRRVIS